MNSNPLEARLHHLIEQDGPIGTDHFMQLALSHPEYGYYRSGIPIGQDGDFITAPEISQMFGELIGLWLYQVACHQDINPDGNETGASLMELGPGRGTLMADILRSLAMVAGSLVWPVRMVEISPALKSAQQEKLRTATNAKPFWTENLSSLPPRPLLLIANEFFDTLPVRQYISRKTGWHERLVSLKDGQLTMSQAETPTPLDLPDQPPGTIAEICPDALEITKVLASHISRHKGAMLLIDYGKSSPIGDSLQAVRDHRPVDILSQPGRTDISAWVDFEAIRNAADDAGSYVAGPVDQGDFLKALGLFERAEQLAEGQDPGTRRMIAAAVDRLTSPAQMGRVFKVMAILPDESSMPVAGF